MGRLALLVLVLGGCGGAATGHGSALPDTAAGRALRTLHFLPACGSAWQVMERVLVTNRHVAQCVAGRPDLYAKQPWVRVLRRSSEKYVDLALLELTDPVRARSIPVRARRPVKKGDLLYTVGPPDARWIDRYLYTMVRDWRIRTYRVAADPVHGGEGLDGVIVVEGQAFRGQSGAPVVTAEGEVVGTLYAATKTHAFIIPVEPYVDDLLGR